MYETVGYMLYCPNLNDDDDFGGSVVEKYRQALVPMMEECNRDCGPGHRIIKLVKVKEA